MVKFNKIATTTNNKRFLLNHIGYKSIKRYLSENTEYRSASEAYETILTDYNDEQDNKRAIYKEEKRKLKAIEKNTIKKFQDLKPSNIK